MTDSSAIMIEHAADVSNGNFYTGDVCTNCFDYVRMAESFENSNELPQSYFDKVDKVLSEYAVFIGHLHGNEFDSRCWHNDSLCESQECCEDIHSFHNWHFSGCFLCGAQLGDDYYQITAVKR